LALNPTLCSFRFLTINHPPVNKDSTLPYFLVQFQGSIVVNITAQPVRVMIDLGLVDPAHAVGFEVDPDSCRAARIVSAIQGARARLREPTAFLTLF
jgi:hypothetical protein